MDYYIELRVLPDAEFTTPILMNALYNKLHKALVKINSNSIGLSLPNYEENKKLGKCIRLHGDQSRLEALMSTDWIQAMRDYVQISTINEIPLEIQHAIFSRNHVKSNASRIRRRQIARHGLNEQEALEKIPDSFEKYLELPFFTIKSQSTQQTFRLFINKRQVSEKLLGQFNTYGLSNESSVPIF
jgi:CRISPR-associated endonuclease Csy4